jgi:hypothetical protein
MIGWKRSLLSVALIGALCLGVKQRGVTGAETAAARIFKVAQPVYKSLTAEQKQKACFGFDAAEKAKIRLTPNLDRPGFPVLHMSAEQKELSLKLLEASLSEQGWKKIKGIMDQPRNQGTNAQGVPNWDYCLAFFGEPTENGTWGYRWEGHHVSVTIDIVNGRVGKFHAALLGSNPDSGKGISDPLEPEAKLGSQLVASLNEDQKPKATMPQKSGGVGQGPIPPQREGGIAFSELSEAQQKIGEQLVQEELNYFPREMTQAPRRAIRQAGGVKACRFSISPDAKENFWGVRGPAFICEYSTSTGHPHLTFRAE